ncbi:vif protein [Human immunodeficiency virus 2]|uniref:Virion infectivity factor n=1 Tax=Human immunodeficiency virus 2 TaxID=11709 RepID=L8AZ79_9HIV2|nr:vif protein [Human immunodeficiency virus 2]
MEEDKNWIVVPTWRVPGRMEKWHSLVKYLKYRTKDLEKVRYVPHHKVGWAWWTCSRVIFPLEGKSHLEIQAYWNLTPEKGWLSSYAVRITWYTERFWTDVTPDYADILIHSTYFSCFTAGEVRRAIRGEKLLSCCNYPQAHKVQVPSLQYLALVVVQQNGRPQRKGTSRKQWRRDHWRGLRVARQDYRSLEQRGSGPSAPRAHFPGVAKVLEILA